MTYDDPPSRARESVVNPDLAFASGETPRVLPNGCIRTGTATAATNEILLYLQCSLGMSTTCCKLRRSLSSEQWNQSTITSVVLFCFPLEPCINGQPHQCTSLMRCMLKHGVASVADREALEHIQCVTWLETGTLSCSSRVGIHDCPWL